VSSAEISPVRRAWFPLRSNASYFEAPARSLDLEQRIKQMSLLSEELVFEMGMLDVTVADHGMSSFWIPPRHLNEEEIRRRRDASGIGQQTSIMIAPQSGLGVPADFSQAHPLMVGTLERVFVAEYHLLLMESGLDGVDWVKWAVPPADMIDEAKRSADLENRREAIGSATSTLPKLVENHFLDDSLKKDMNLDLALGGLMGVPVMVDELRAPVLEAKTADPDARHRAGSAPGARALHALAPNFSLLPWADIIALHDDDAIGAFRARLLEFEAEVEARSEEEWEDAIRELALDEAIKKANDRIPRTTETVAEVAVDFLAGLVPGVSQAVTLAKAAATIQGAREERRNEWLAVLLTLRQSEPAERSRP
jgi:hypothetical protein